MSNDDAEPAKPVGQWAQKSNPTVLSLEGTECVDEVKRGALVASNPLSARSVTGLEYAAGVSVTMLIRLPR